MTTTSFVGTGLSEFFLDLKRQRFRHSSTVGLLWRAISLWIGPSSGQNQNRILSLSEGLNRMSLNRYLLDLRLLVGMICQGCLC